MNRTTRSFRNLALAIIAVAAAAGTTVAPALAHDWHHDRDWRHHDARRHPVVYAAPYVSQPVIVAAPAPAYYPAPPQAYIAAPAASFSINIPLAFR